MPGFRNKNLQVIVLLSIVVLLRIVQAETCPEGCYSCEKQKETEDLLCNGCWFDRLGLNGCPPLSIKHDDCLLYYKTGVCLVCQKGSIPYTYVDKQGYISSKCKKTTQNDVVWGFYDHSTKNEFMRVCDQGFPSFRNAKCVRFNPADPVSEHCLWGSGHKGCSKCFRCKAGFLSYFGLCRPTIEEGCLQIIEGDLCRYCDHWNGYYMRTPGKCAKYAPKQIGCVNNFLRNKEMEFIAFSMFN